MADKAMVRAFAAGPRAPTVRLVLMTGRADFLEKWADILGALEALGVGLYAFDWRGQGGSARLVASDAGHIDSFDTWIADLDLLMPAAVAALPAHGPLVVLAHSMGAHLLLRWMAGGGPARTGVAPDALVLTAPMVDLALGGPLRAAAMWLARSEVRKGRATGWAPGQGPYGPDRQAPARMKILTSDPDRFLDEGRWVAAKPALAVGGVTWGWLAAADASIKALALADLSAVTCPVLMLLAERERLVSNPRARALARRLPDCRVETVAGAGHEILREADGPRQRALSLVADFLARACA